MVRFWILAILVTFFVTTDPALARRRRRYTGPPPTHPVVLWSRALETSTDLDQRRVAAFKLSQYSQTIYQDHVIRNLLKGATDPDGQVKVLCTKALGRAGTQSQAEWVRKELLTLYKNDPSLRNTIVRTFITRKDSSSAVQEIIIDAIKNTSDPEDITTLLSYLKLHGSGSDDFVNSLIALYEKNTSTKIKRAIVQALAERGQNQAKLVELLVACSDSKDTPLTLTCLGGLQLQARNNPLAWEALKKTITSDDPDMILSSLDVINVLPESSHPEIAPRLVEILHGNDDVEIQEKAVLALGVCGDHSETVVTSLENLLHNKGTDEPVRIASALVSGKQADAFPDKVKATLSKCLTEEKSQSLKTACQLGLQDLETRRTALAAAAAKSATDAREPAKEVPVKTEKPAEVAPSPAPSPNG